MTNGHEANGRPGGVGGALPIQLLCVAGARPNFMKVAPILEAARQRPEVEARLVHTGQHYDRQMSALFFDELGLPAPDVHLGVGSASHAVQTARIMEAFDAVLDERPCDMVLVVGDVNSTIACALVAVKRGVAVAHVEAGLRSFDRSMPEEINRVLTDQVSDLLFVTERSAFANLAREGIPADRVRLVGNVMIDTLLRHREAARRRPVVAELGLAPRGYALCTIHRPSNVDSEEAAERTARSLGELARRMPVVFPVHPRTAARFREFGVLDRVPTGHGIRLMEPLGYWDFLALMDAAALVFTDSGGIQEETTVLGVPCLTFRENTERPVTITEGTNRLVGLSPEAVAAEVDALLGAKGAAGRVPELWDGKAAERIVSAIVEWTAAKRACAAAVSEARAL